MGVMQSTGQELARRLLSFARIYPFVLLQYPLEAVGHEGVLKQLSNIAVTWRYYGTHADPKTMQSDKLKGILQTANIKYYHDIFMKCTIIHL
jgi:hypothetical protein